MREAASLLTEAPQHLRWDFLINQTTIHLLSDNFSYSVREGTV